MVGALDRLRESAALLLAKSGPPVAAHVVVRPQCPGPVSKDYDALPSDRLQEVVTWVGEAILPSDAEPAAGEDSFGFLLEYLRGHVIPAGQRLGAMDGDLRRLE